MAKISIIVPIYNAEKYLDQCIESLVNQTYRDIEILLVDDGSTDHSGSICDQWAKTDSRIVVIHKENGGLASARFEGLRNATAEYVGFLDSDDYFHELFCKTMLLAIELNHADLVECGYTIFSPTHIKKHELWRDKLNLSRQAFLDQIVRQTIVSGTEAVVVWNKLYKTQVIQQYVISAGESPLEDYLFNMQYYRGVQRYVYIPECLVNYRQVQNSLSRRCNPRTFDILKEVDAQKTTTLTEMGLVSPEDNKQAALWFVQYTHAFLTAYLQSANKNKRTFIYQILTDPILIEKCTSISDCCVWSKLVTNGRLTSAYNHLQRKVMHNKIRYQLAKIKAKLKR